MHPSGNSVNVSSRAEVWTSPRWFFNFKKSAASSHSFLDATALNPFDSQFSESIFSKFTENKNVTSGERVVIDFLEDKFL